MGEGGERCYTAVEKRFTHNQKVLIMSSVHAGSCTGKLLTTNQNAEKM